MKPKNTALIAIKKSNAKRITTVDRPSTREASSHVVGIAPLAQSQKPSHRLHCLVAPCNDGGGIEELAFRHPALGLDSIHLGQLFFAARGFPQRRPCFT
jgi:hypothetical protein